MKKFTCCFILLLCSFHTQAQSSQKLDSLKKVLAKLPKEGASFAGDTMRVRVLCEMGDIEKDSLVAKKYLYTACNISSKISWKAGVALAKNTEGRLLLQSNFYYQAIDALNIALQIGRELNNYSIISTSNKYLGAVYYMLGDDKTAILYYQKASENYKNISKRQYCTIQSNIGLCLIRLKKFDDAISKYNEALNLYKPTNDSLPISWFYSNLGTAQRGAGLIKKSIESFDSSLNYTPKYPVSERAFTTSEKALSYLKLGNIKIAIQLAKNAAKWGINTTNFEKTYIYENLYHILKANGDSKNALIAYEDWMRLKNQNDEDMKKKSIEGLKMYYENQQKEAVIKQEKYKSNSLFFGLFGALVLTFLVLRNNHLLKGKNQQIQSQSAEIEIINKNLEDLNQNLENKVEERTFELVKAYSEIKIAMTKGQSYERERVASELHDNLGGMISSIKYQMQALEQDKLMDKEKLLYGKIYKLIGEAYSEIRNISHNLAPKVLEENGLRVYLFQFVDNLNDNQKIAFKINFPQNLSIPKEYEIDIYSIIMELINNTLKHSNAKKVQIDFRKKQSKINIIINEDGKGFDLKTVKKGKGIENITSRLKKMNGELNYHNEVGNSIFEISFPFC